MNIQPHFKIAIVEDNDFYNRLLKKHISNYIGTLAIDKLFSFDILSFVSFEDWERNFDNRTDVIITDYFLDKGFNALHVLETVKEKQSGCKVVVISRSNNLATSIATLLEGACDFIVKDEQTLNKSGYIIEEIISQKRKRK